MANFYRIYLILILFIQVSFLYAQNPLAYEQRRQAYITNGLANGGNDKLSLQAYQNVPLNNVALTNKLNSISTGETSDFDIIDMVRVLFLTNGQYDAQILPVLNSVPYWVNYNDTVRNYWSENHMIMWMSSDWLLHEKYNKPIDANLEARLKHYLQLKIDYGFYEFFSSVYAPYTFNGLVNLADFAQDTTIKNLATQAAQLVLKEFLVLTNDKGAYYPAAGRNYPNKYNEPYGANHNSLIYLLTGFGDAPNNASLAGSFLVTSTLPVADVINSWQPLVDSVYTIGHTLQEGFAINSAMAATDKTVFQWSSGAYFHPDVSQQTGILLTDSSLWNQVDFAVFQPLSTLPLSGIQYFSEILSFISKSTVISGQDVVIYKHNAITLSSIKDFWKGKVGFQQYPCVANVGTTAVYTASGQVFPDWEDRNDKTQNTHLPYVEQHQNLALIMYRPEPTDPIVGPDFDYKDVALRFNDSAFDEVAEDGLWLLGRQADRYVAVRRSCIGEINGVRACPTIGGQTWVLMVGDSILYNSFTNFKNIVNQAEFTEEWYYDSLTAQNVYYAKIEIDSTTIDYAWGRDSVTVGVDENLASAIGMSIYPNPANDIITIKTQNIQGPSKVELYSISGQLVYSTITTTQQLQIPVNNLNSGLYAVKLFTANGKVLVKRVVVEN